MPYSENVNKPFNNILMLDSDLLIKMCIQENNSGTSVCVIGMAGFMLHPGLFCSRLSVHEHGRVSSVRHSYPFEPHGVCVPTHLLLAVVVSPFLSSYIKYCMVCYLLKLNYSHHLIWKPLFTPPYNLKPWPNPDSALLSQQTYTALPNVSGLGA